MRAEGHQASKIMLPSIKRSLKECCSQQPNVGYSRMTQKRSKLKTENVETEKTLSYEIQNLDALLNKNMVIIDGLLFTTEVNSRLVQSINEELKRSKGAFDLECFGNILQNPQQEQVYQPMSVYKRIRVLGRHNQDSYYESKANVSVNHSQISSPPQKLTNSHQESLGNIFNSNDLERFLKKHLKCVSLWLPPTSYPQFYGYVTYGKIKVSSSRQTILVLERLYVPRYVNPTKMFRPLLQYLSRNLQKHIDILELMTSKQNYHLRYKKWGWKLRAIHEHRYKLWWDQDENQRGHSPS